MSIAINVIEVKMKVLYFINFFIAFKKVFNPFHLSAGEVGPLQCAIRRSFQSFLLVVCAAYACGEDSLFPLKGITLQNERHDEYPEHRKG